MKVETAGFARTAVSSLPSLIESRVSLNHRRGYHFEPKRLPEVNHTIPTQSHGVNDQ
jgi:hypothetical protein